MNVNQTPVIWTVIIATIVLLVAGLFAYMAIPTADEVSNNIDVPTTAEIQAMIDSGISGLDIPTADEIAAEITVPKTSSNNEKINELWNLIFGVCYDLLEESAEIDAIDEVEDNMPDMINFIEDNVEDFDVIGTDPIPTEPNETEVTVKEIGYCLIEDISTYGSIGDEEDDKVAEVILEYDFTYENTETTSPKHKGTVIVTVLVTYEHDEEGDIEDTEFEISYALA